MNWEPKLKPFLTDLVDIEDFSKFSGSLDDELHLALDLFTGRETRKKLLQDLSQAQGEFLASLNNQNNVYA